MSHSITDGPSRSIGPQLGRSRKNLTIFTRFYRLMLITSLYIKFTKYEGEISNELLDTINSKFQVVSRIDALWVPAILSNWLWRKYDPKKTQLKYKAGACSLFEAISEIYEAVPKIGQYVDISTDIESVLLQTLEN